MKRVLLALAAATVLSSPAFAAKIGVSMDKFDDNFLTVLRNGMTDYAKTLPGVTIQVEDAKDDVSKQLSQVQNFIANGVDAIIVNPVDTSATGAITKAAASAPIRAANALGGRRALDRRSVAWNCTCWRPSCAGCVPERTAEVPLVCATRRAKNARCAKSLVELRNAVVRTASNRIP